MNLEALLWDVARRTKLYRPPDCILRRPHDDALLLQWWRGADTLTVCPSVMDYHLILPVRRARPTILLGPLTSPAHLAQILHQFHQKAIP